VFISRPLDGYDLQVRILKVTLNGSVPGDAFELTPPPGTKVERIDEAAEAATSGVVKP
jgi:outer membrane lipoprotein-sorting protein